MKAQGQMLLTLIIISVLVCSCGKQPDVERRTATQMGNPVPVESVMKDLSEMRYDSKVYIESIPNGALVIFFPGTAEAPAGKSRSLGETPLAVDSSALGSGRIVIAFRTQKLYDQLSRIPELRELMSEFKKEMADNRSSFAENSYAAQFYSGKYFQFPSPAKEVLVAEDGELVAFGPVFDHKNGRVFCNRYVAWALPVGKRPSCLITFMPASGTYVAPNTTESTYEHIPEGYRQEAHEYLSRCGYYAWIDEQGEPYCAQTAQAMAAGRIAMFHEIWSPGRH